jgi:DNA-directed RNA polymerase specialized sigma24 family protein
MPGSSFHPTQWTVILRARGRDEGARQALSDLCAAYYAPVVAFLKREGRSEDVARELAHEFFAGILESGVGHPERERGRFRSYLLGTLKHFMSRQRDAAHALKRGGHAEHIPIAHGAETQAGIPLPGVEDDTLCFDREWALTLIQRALTALESEHAGKPLLFSTLRPWLDGGASGTQSDAARQLGMTETAVKVTIHRLRSRFRELIRAEVAATVQEPDEVAAELRHLIAVATTAP